MRGKLGLGNILNVEMTKMIVVKLVKMNHVFKLAKINHIDEQLCTMELI